jgi:single-stranded-DNA-specific exonuclease
VKHTPWVGLNALIDASRLRDEKIDSYHAGFVLGPRLNACGRMGHARQAVKLLTDPQPDEALSLAQLLNTANDRRRAIERQIFEQARAMVMEGGHDRDDCRVIVLAHDQWHPGVVGIVCSRLVEKFGRPAVLLCTCDGQAHGSARSIDGFDIHAAFSACAGHLQTFGGHSMAAGLRLAADSIDPFRQAMLDHARSRLTPHDLSPVLDIDAELTLAEVSVDAVQQLQRLQPFGRDNRSPVFLVRSVQLRQAAMTMGAHNKHLCLIAHQDSSALRCIAWNLGHLREELPAGARLDLAAEPRLNNYNGRTTVELHIADLRNTPATDEA